jgi:hypothetical protein
MRGTTTKRRRGATLLLAALPLLSMCGGPPGGDAASQDAGVPSSSGHDGAAAESGMLADSGPNADSGPSADDASADGPSAADAPPTDGGAAPVGDGGRAQFVGVTTRTWTDATRPTPQNGSQPTQPSRTLVTEIWYPTSATSLTPPTIRDAPLAPGGPYPRDRRHRRPVRAARRQRAVDVREQ